MESVELEHDGGDWDDGDNALVSCNSGEGRTSLGSILWWEKEIETMSKRCATSGEAHRWKRESCCCSPAVEAAMN